MSKQDVIKCSSRLVMAVITKRSAVLLNRFEHQYLGRNLPMLNDNIYLQILQCYSVELMCLLWSTIVILISTLSVDLN